MSDTDTTPNLSDQVRARLGAPRCEALATQPQCLGNGGLDAVMQQACLEAGGQLIAATVRTLQLCGSLATAEDLVP